MFIGTDFRYRYYFINGNYYPDFCRKLDVFNHNLDHWRRFSYAVLRLNADPVRSQDGIDLSAQRLSVAAHNSYCAARFGKGDYA